MRGQIKGDRRHLVQEIAVMADDMASLTDKCKVIDRAINIEKLKQKISDDEWGSGFINTEDE